MMTSKAASEVVGNRFTEVSVAFRRKALIFYLLLQDRNGKKNFPEHGKDHDQPFSRQTVSSCPQHSRQLWPESVKVSCHLGVNLTTTCQNKAIEHLTEFHTEATDYPWYYFMSRSFLPQTGQSLASPCHP